MTPLRTGWHDTAAALDRARRGQHRHSNPLPGICAAVAFGFAAVAAAPAWWPVLLPLSLVVGAVVHRTNESENR